MKQYKYSHPTMNIGLENFKMKFLFTPGHMNWDIYFWFNPVELVLYSSRQLQVDLRKAERKIISRQSRL